MSQADVDIFYAAIRRQEGFEVFIIASLDSESDFVHWPTGILIDGSSITKTGISDVANFEAHHQLMAFKSAIYRVLIHRIANGQALTQSDVQAAVDYSVQHQLWFDCIAVTQQAVDRVLDLLSLSAITGEQAKRRCQAIDRAAQRLERGFVTHPH
ncbi:hypothetical protein J2I47_00850 [Fibrella sp. HMF5335]|uniref:Uncharacterized protein n=1 Tax=Fibrella rubiginis TaxID=2817060 RepID=A0A939G9S4_9BACT|nr:hypothetical protein [Fibrella rubiginis]MBO0935082.1 hypothetical protein [Fibrella rubiginis]